MHLVSTKKPEHYERASALLRPAERLTSDVWARRNREYALTAPVPGPRNPNLTPYIIPIVRALDARQYRRVCGVFGTQMSKTELALDVIGNRLDSAPVPMAYIMPSEKTLREIIEPRIKELLSTSSLAAKSAKRQSVTNKKVAGVRLRLVTANSASDLAADSLGLVVTDEIDKFPVNVKGQGGAVGLADRRGDAYSDFVHFSTSSPTAGPIEVEHDPESGLDFWGFVEQDDLRSPIWSMWQGGTRYHWAWPCPHCDTFFIPRFRCVTWEKPLDKEGNELPSSAALARRTAHMVCQTCTEKIFDEHKPQMNARGVFVAPGQRIDPNGKVIGDPPDAWTLSFWVSGFCSPFVPWGQRVAEFIEATNARKIDDIQTIVNGFGELFVPGNGDLPEWAELRALKRDYSSLDVPAWVRLLTLAADVQKDRIYYTIRGWGEEETTCLVHAGVLMGDTSTDEAGGIWDALGNVVTATYDGLPLRLALIDSGYRPGKKFVVPDHLVYKFCRRHPRLAYPTKGASSEMRRPIVSSKLDVRIDGKTFKRGIELLRLDTGHLKRWLTMKLTAPTDRPGGFFLPKDISDDYLKQMVSEVEITLPSGKRKWVQRSKANHFLDCESMQGAASIMLNIKVLGAGPRLQRKPRSASVVKLEPRSVDDSDGMENVTAPQSGEGRAVKSNSRGSRQQPKNGSIWRGNIVVFSEYKARRT